MIAPALFLLLTPVPAGTAVAAPRATGLWFGDLHLCADRVTGIEAGTEVGTGRLRVTVRFSAAFAPQVAALTRSRLRKPLSIVLDGTIIAHPIVIEPLSRAASIVLDTDFPVDRVRRAASSAC